ncbi:hypothetical protein BDZ89DRAFT_1056686 [Hymenopellis radicata]|nr:hypothetical protein BDZ89DRAFT_1056686 [Hymenopellis radicata]
MLIGRVSPLAATANSGFPADVLSVPVCAVSGTAVTIPSQQCGMKPRGSSTRS